jgi:ABC-type Mn2+/Zn2+ transport system permease subunit
MNDPQFVSSLVVAIFAGGIGGYLGSLMITKKMALTGDAIGHLALPGVALALMLNVNLTYGALISLLAGVLIIWGLEIKTKISTEALTGIVFTASTATAFLFLEEKDLESALVGDITSIGKIEAIITVITLIAVFFVTRSIYKKMVLMSLSDDVAKVEKINTKKINLIYLLCIAITVALGIKVVGSLLIGALVIIPAAAAKNLSKSMTHYAYGGMALGVLSCIIGILIYERVGFSAGPIIILTSTAFFIISVIFKTKN